jgi:hypothetical protein
MLSYGTNLTLSPGLPLVPISVPEVTRLIREDEFLRLETDRLRVLRNHDPMAYRHQKRYLPYVVGADFGGGRRHSSDFVAAHFLLLDLDHLPLSDHRVPESIRQHPAVRLAFVSPGGEGVKVLCALAEPCDSLYEFKAYYKYFAHQFAGELHLEKYLDLSTCDATRACFLAHDPHVFDNPQANPLNWRPG